MKLETKRAKLAELLGMDWTPPTEPEPRTEADDLRSREAEAVLGYLTTPLGHQFALHLFRYVSCKQCEREFACSLANVAYCSDDCRMSALKEFGISWNPEKPAEERWAGIPQPVNVKLGDKFVDEVALKRLNSIPLVIPPEAIPIVQALHLEDQPVPVHTQVQEQNQPEHEVPQSIREILDGNIDDLLG